MTSHIDDHGFDGYMGKIQARFDAFAKDQPLFTTSVEGLFGLFISKLPADQQQYHTCNCCRRFIQKYGGLVVIGEDGEHTSPFWNEFEAPQMYQRSIRAMRQAVDRAVVTGVFYSSERTWGVPEAGGWSHFSIKPGAHIFWNATLTADQKSAEKRVEHGALCRALHEFSSDTVRTAVNFLETGSLYRAERVVAPAKWLLDLVDRRAQLANATNRRRIDNVTWLALATAAPGFATPKSGVLGTLLEDIEAGLSQDEIAARFADKMDPTRYQRAQVDPSAGQIAAAERLVEQMGIQRSLLRRYAKLEELPTIWRPTTVKAGAPKATNGVFAHLAQPTAAPRSAPVPTVTMTWEKFQRTVLRTAQKIEVLVPNSADRFMALVTAADLDAPPILQWDVIEWRNPFSWYYASGIDAEMRQRLVDAGGQFENVDIRCSLMWNNYNDLDLHCITPEGSHIYYGNRTACRYGGNLDVDMNAGQGHTNKPVENIRWAKGRAPMGMYRFYVNLFTTHRGGPVVTPFTVEIEVEGKVVRFQGKTRCENPTNQLARMERVGTFTYRRGDVTNIVVPADAAVSSTVSSEANAWGLTPGTYAPVTAVVQSPNMWSDRPLTQHGQHIFFLLEGCRDAQQGVGRGFFTEMLKGDLRPVRSVLEKYAALATIEGMGDADACGVGISSASTGDTTLRVTTATGQAVYKLDRWD